MLVFLVFLMTFAVLCAVLRADGPEYCESLDICVGKGRMGPRSTHCVVLYEATWGITLFDKLCFKCV